MDRRSKRYEYRPWGMRFNLPEAFDFSQISEKRRHLYVYSFLVLIILLVHVLKTSTS